MTIDVTASITAIHNKCACSGCLFWLYFMGHISLSTSLLLRAESPMPTLQTVGNECTSIKMFGEKRWYCDNCSFIFFLICSVLGSTPSDCQPSTTFASQHLNSFVVLTYNLKRLMLYILYSQHMHGWLLVRYVYVLVTGLLANKFLEYLRRHGVLWL